jgi:hypothetical protein
MASRDHVDLDVLPFEFVRRIQNVEAYGGQYVSTDNNIISIFLFLLKYVEVACYFPLVLN